MGGAKSGLNVALTRQIVVAYLDHNPLPADDVARLLVSVHAALTEIGRPLESADAADLNPPTQDEIRRSITPEALISFEDGRPYKMLTRHLARRSLSPAAYRAKWGLPFDYPMTAPRLSAIRTAVAKAAGLGRLRRAGREGSPPAPTIGPVLEGVEADPREAA